MKKVFYEEVFDYRHFYLRRAPASWHGALALIGTMGMQLG